jgi:hypothetical protein
MEWFQLTSVPNPKFGVQQRLTNFGIGALVETQQWK